MLFTVGGGSDSDEDVDTESIDATSGPEKSGEFYMHKWKRAHTEQCTHSHAHFLTAFTKIFSFASAPLVPTYSTYW